MGEQKAGVIAEGQVEKKINATKNCCKGRHQKPVAVDKSAQPGAQPDRPTRCQPKEGINQADALVHQPQSSFDTGVLLGLFLAVGVNIRHCLNLFLAHAFSLSLFIFAF